MSNNKDQNKTETNNPPTPKFTVEQIVAKFVVKPDQRRIIGDNGPLVQFSEHNRKKKDK